MVPENKKPVVFDDDNPEWTEEDFARAIPVKGDLLAATKELRRRRGRPPAEAPKQLISLRLDQDIIAKFKAGGPGWQSRINEALRKAV